MAGLFESLPERSNGPTVDAGWFNAIRTLLMQIFGGGAIRETTFTFSNNTGPANVTGLSFDKTLYRSAIVKFCVRRKTDTASSEVRTVHTLTCLYNTQADAWSVQDEAAGDDDGITFSITSAGQVQYTSSDITGSNGVHNGRFKAETFNA